MLIGKNLFYKEYVTKNAIREFHVIYKKPKKMVAYRNCKKCKTKNHNTILHLFKIGLENMHYDNLFICENCFEKLEGPDHKIEDLTCS